MSEIYVYKWDNIRKYFPPERVAEIRAKILELRESGKYTDRELWEMYGMSERTFYYLVERAKDGSRAEDLKDRPSKPKNPFRKLTDEDKAEIINLCLDDRSSIRIQLLLFHNNQNNVYSHSFSVSLVFVELPCPKASKREQKAHFVFFQKTPTLY